MFSLCVCQLYDKSGPVKRELRAFAFKISTVGSASLVCVFVCATQRACLVLHYTCVPVTDAYS